MGRREQAKRRQRQRQRNGNGNDNDNDKATATATAATRSVLSMVCGFCCDEIWFRTSGELEGRSPGEAWGEGSPLFCLLRCYRGRIRRGGSRCGRGPPCRGR